VNASNRRKHATSPARYAIAAVFAAIAGFGTVYLLFGPSDNGSGPISGPKSTESSESGVTGDVTGSPLKGLNKGAMAAFVVRPEPLDLPEFSFDGPDGPEESADLKGKVVLLNIWATWCVPCREEMPQLNALQAELGGENFEVVAINVDKNGAEKARDFLAETGATDLALYTDPSGKLFATLKAVGMPTTLLLDREGKEMGRLVGPADWASSEAKTLIEAAIAASTSDGAS
jgi:thiol-disulfide isomerase/thioredoxin